MAKPSKFSFARSSKRARPSATGLTSGPREVSQLSKVERILGTGLAATRTPNYHTQTTIERQPSYASLQASLPSHSEDFDFSEGMVSPASIEDVVIPPRKGSLRQKASSNALGAAAHGADSGSVTSTYTYTARLNDSRSNSTLKSFYDARKLPLEVTQQTSASAIRDRALRKGKSPVVVVSESRSGLDGMRSASDRAHGTGQENLDKEKKRPTRLDLARLFPRPSFSGPKLFSPNKAPFSPASPAHTSEYFPLAARSSRKKSTLSTAATSHEANTLRKPRGTQPIAQMSAVYQSQYDDEELVVVKSHVRRPPRGAQNWFDGLLEEEDEIDLEVAHEISTPNTELFSPEAIDQSFHRSSVESYDPSVDDREPLYIPSPIPSPQESKFTDNSPHALTTSYAEESTRSVHTKRSRFGSSDLGDMSLLSTSSSDEDESARDSIDSRLPQVRDSIQVADDDSILIGKAQAFELRPKRKDSERVDTEHDCQPYEASNRSAVSNPTAADNISLQSSNNEPTYLTVPPTKSRSRRSGHTRQPSLIPEDNDNGPSTSTSSNSPPSFQALRSPLGETHKLMAVTEEEEALLEMMRRKRAAMAKHSFAEGYKTALRQDNQTPRTPPRKANKVTPPRAARGFRPLSTSSSILDSFPVSRSQRSSMILHSNSSAQTNVFMMATESSQATSPQGRTRQRALKTRSTLLSPFDAPTTPNYVFPPLSLAPIDVTISPMPSPTLAHQGASSPSPEPLPSPSTPDTKRSSADMFRVAGSQRESLNSTTNMGAVTENMENRAKLNSTRVVSHVRRRTASSDANMLSSDGESECGMGDAVDPALQRKGNRTSIASFNEVAKRSSILSMSTRGPSCKPYYDNSSLLNADGMSRGLNRVSSHYSVNEDVMAVWGSLGGWRDSRT
jgi:hypothetical protein